MCCSSMNCIVLYGLTTITLVIGYFVDYSPVVGIWKTERGGKAPLPVDIVKLFLLFRILTISWAEFPYIHVRTISIQFYNKSSSEYWVEVFHVVVNFINISIAVLVYKGAYNQPPQEKRVVFQLTKLRRP